MGREMLMGQLTNSTIHIKKVKEHLRQFNLELYPIVRGHSEERASELAELVSIYNMMQSLKASMAKDMAILELYLTKIENQRLNSANEKGMQQHCHAGTESLAEKLSRREREVLLTFAKGYSYNEAAEILSCKIATIQTYTKRIYKKLKVHSRSEAVFEAKQLGIIHL
jgi:DNA-binding CsgD family transcriptional regulator